MSDQTEEPEDDGFPPVHFALRNMEGTADTVTLSNPWLGTELYLLVQPGEGAIQVEGSHMTFEEMAQALAVIVASALQADIVTDEVREAVRELINDAVEEVSGG